MISDEVRSNTDDDHANCRSDCIGVEGIARLWEIVLEVPCVHVDDDFFNIGGTSLLAIRMLDEIAQVTNVQFGTRELYENPTPADLHARMHLDADGTTASPR